MSRCIHQKASASGGRLPCGAACFTGSACSCSCTQLLPAWLRPAGCSLGRCVGRQALSGPKGFLSKARMSIFSTKRNDPNNAEAVSHLSPYIHFGVIAPQRCALEAAKLRSKYKARTRAAPCDACKEGRAASDARISRNSLTGEQRSVTAC